MTVASVQRRNIQVEEQADGNDNEHEVVGPEDGGEEHSCKSGRRNRGDEAGTTLRAGRNGVPVHRHPKHAHGRQNRRPRGLRDDGDGRDDVDDGDRPALDPAPRPAGRIAQEGMHQRTPVEGDEQGAEARVAGPPGVGERAQEPGEPGRDEEDSRPALRTPVPGDDAANHEDEADREVRDRESNVRGRSGSLEQATSERGPFGEDPERYGGGDKGEPRRRPVHLTLR